MANQHGLQPSTLLSAAPLRDANGAKVSYALRALSFRKTPMIQREPLVLNFEQSEWDLAGCEDLAKLLKPTYTHPNVILDLTPVTFMDGSCLREVARMQAERAKRGFPPVHLVVASAHIRRVFKIVQFDRVRPLYDKLESALAAARGALATEDNIATG